MENYFEVLELSIDDIQGQDEATIERLVKDAKTRLYGLTTGSYANVPRSDGRTQGQWQQVLNDAEKTLIDPQKRREHIAELTRHETTEFDPKHLEHELEQQRLEREREREQLEQERLERERERERLEQERLEREREQERLEQERLERERERERLEQERLEREREQQHLEQQRLEQLREQQRFINEIMDPKKQRLEQQRLERLEQQRDFINEIMDPKKQRLEHEREQQRLEQQRLEHEREQQRLEQQRLEQRRERGLEREREQQHLEHEREQQRLEQLGFGRELLAELFFILGKSKTHGTYSSEKKQRMNYFEVLELSIDDIQGQKEGTIKRLVEGAHRRLYALTLRVDANVPRADGRTQAQWQQILNDAAKTLINPRKRREHIAELSEPI